MGDALLTEIDGYTFPGTVTSATMVGDDMLVVVYTDHPREVCRATADDDGKLQLKLIAAGNRHQRRAALAGGGALV